MRQFSTPFGKLKSIEVLNESESLANKEVKNWVVLFHGYGADAYDLSSLTEVLTPAQPSNWLFPQGVLEVPIGPGWTGRAWWQIDVVTLQQRQSMGEQVDLSGEKPEGLNKIRPMLLKVIEDLGVGWENIILGGFSQGAMLATDLFLHAPQTPKGLMIFSGALINKDVWKPLVAGRSGSRFFICHGQQDMVLAHRTGQQLETLLNGGGMKGGLFSFKGGHEIPPQAIIKANEYLKSLN